MPNTPNYLNAKPAEDFCCINIIWVFGLFFFKYLLTRELDASYLLKIIDGKCP